MTQQPQPQGDPWVTPTGNSSLFSPSDHVGALTMFAVRAFHHQLPGTFGAKDAVECGVDIVAEPRNPTENGKRYESVLLYGVAVVDELKDKVGSYVLSHLTAKPTQNPSPVIVLDDPTPQEQQQAREHVQRYGLMSLVPKASGEVAALGQAHAQAFQQQTGQPPPQYQQPQQQPQQPYQQQPQQPTYPAQPPAGVGQPAPWQQQPTDPPF